MRGILRTARGAVKNDLAAATSNRRQPYTMQKAVVTWLPIFAMVAGSALAQEYTLISFDSPGGGPGSQAFGINDAGQVVGTAGGEAFIWDPANGIRGLGLLHPGDLSTEALAVNAFGQVVGESRQNDPPFDSTRAFRWDSINGMIDLGDFGAPGRYVARDINDSGQVVGTGQPRNEQGVLLFPSPFLWDATNGLVRLDVEVLCPTGIGGASAINNSGQVVGGVSCPLDHLPWIWHAQTGMQTFAAFPESTANGLNDLGQVVGTGKSADNFPNDEAFVWNPTDGIRGLGDLPGGVEASRGQAINHLGQVVGSSVSARGEEAMIWDSVHGIRALRDLLDETGDGWILREATGINGRGQIVGYGVDPGGEGKGFLLTPILNPSPAAPTISQTGQFVLATLLIAVMPWAIRRRNTH